MPRLTARFALSTALAIATLLGAAAPGHAQAQPIVTGDGAVTNTAVGPVAVELSLIELPNGSLHGGGTVDFAVTGGYVTFDLTSYMFVQGRLCMAGSVTSSFAAPPNYFVGATVVFCVEDGGNGAGMDRLAGTVAPPGLTIQQIIALIGPPPPQAYQPVVTGNFKLH